MEFKKIIIVEDELLVAASLKIMVEAMGYLVVQSYVSAIDFISDFKSGQADVVLMDIQLKGEMTGAEAGKVIAKLSTIPIIYLTNVSEGEQKNMAIKDTNISYYLNKPFNRSSLQTALDITLKNITKGTRLVAPKQDKLLKDSIFIKEGQSHTPIKLTDIVYLKADGSYCELYGLDKKYIYSENLSYFGEKLSFSENFIRIHRSYIVNAQYIEKIRDNTIWINGEPLPIGKSYRDALLSRFRFLS